MDSIVSLINVRIAGQPTFFPGEEPGKHRCLMTVIKNRGKNKAGVEMTDEFSLVFWGKYAQTAALYLDKGRAICVEGVLRSYTKETGKVRPNGKKELQRTTSVNVNSFEFGPPSKKELVKIIGTNLAMIEAAKAAGTRSPTQPLVADELINIPKTQGYDYNPTLAAQTGMYGNARVFIKGQGWLGVTGAPVAAQVTDQKLAEMEAEVLRLKSLKASAAASPAAEVVGPANPFPGA